LVLKSRIGAKKEEREYICLAIVLIRDHTRLCVNFKIRYNVWIA
jgi:hypothetical protein